MFTDFDLTLKETVKLYNNITYINVQSIPQSSGAGTTL